MLAAALLLPDYPAGRARAAAVIGVWLFNWSPWVFLYCWFGDAGFVFGFLLFCRRMKLLVDECFIETEGWEHLLWIELFFFLLFAILVFLLGRKCI